jgi:hypothetical protein
MRLEPPADFSPPNALYLLSRWGLQRHKDDYPEIR